MIRQRPDSIKVLDKQRADHLRLHESIRFRPLRVDDVFAEFVREQIAPKLDLGNRNLLAKQDLVSQIMANLFLAAKAGKTLADSRDSSRPGVKRRTSLYDQLEAAGLVIKQIGSQQSRKVTRYDLSMRGNWMRKREDFQLLEIVDVRLERNSRSRPPSESAPVVLRDADKQPKPFPRMKRAERDRIREMEIRIDAINRNNLENHTWVFYREINGRRVADQPNVVVRALFNEDFDHGGRLYSWTVNGYTSLSKAERRTMRIDGEEIAELDYSGFHTRMLYHKAGINFQGDVYQPNRVFPEVDEYTYAHDGHRKSIAVAGRKLAKVATNIILNARSEKSAGGAVWKTIRQSRPFRKVAYEVCQTSPLGIVRRIKELHEPISRHFHTGVGLRLQSEDVWLMIDILTQFVQAEKPALGLHDAVVCRRSDVDFARRAMDSCYTKCFRFHPVIKRDF